MLIIGAGLSNVPNMAGPFRLLIGGVGSLAIFGYLGWSFLGMELPARASEPLPIVRPSSSTRSSGRSGGYYGGRSSSGYSSGGWSFGK